jgi:hypothetical protein
MSYWIGEGWMICGVEGLDAQADVLRLLTKFKRKITKEGNVGGERPGP